MKNLRLRSRRILVPILFILAISCGENKEELSGEFVDASVNESSLESTTDELDDLARVAMTGADQAAGGRIAVDDRIACAGTTVVVEQLSDDKTSGRVVITFGPEGCTDNRGNVRKGKVTVSWSGGRWFQEGSTHTIALDGYSINDLAIVGTRTLTCVDRSGSLSEFTIAWNVTASHTFTWPDQTTALRTVNRTKTWAHVPGEDTFTITNGPSSQYAAVGSNRRGASYTMTIEEPLVYLASCVVTTKVFLPVSGVKLFTNVETEKSFTIDFGDGGCDNTFTVTAEGASREVTAGND